MKVLCVIPARWKSTRFPGKILHEIAGKPMIQHVWERVAETTTVDQAIVATDGDKIADYCKANNIDVIMTSPDHETGTDRAAEVAARIDADIYVNVQGDEPIIDPASIDTVVNLLKRSIDKGIEVSTGYIAEATPEQLEDKSAVQLVKTLDDCVLTFSRYPIPYGHAEEMQRTVHVGLYAMTRPALKRFAAWERGPVERAESIELMRYVERGERIACTPIPPGSIGVDTPADAAAVEAILAAAS